MRVCCTHLVTWDRELAYFAHAQSFWTFEDFSESLPTGGNNSTCTIRSCSNKMWPLNRLGKGTYFRCMIWPLIYQYFTKMAFSGSRISQGIFSDYPRDLNLQAAENSWLYPTSWVAGIKFELTFNHRISKSCVSLQGRPWKRFEVISSKALPVRAMRVIFTMPTNWLSKAI